MRGASANGDVNNANAVHWVAGRRPTACVKLPVRAQLPASVARSPSAEAATSGTWGPNRGLSQDERSLHQAILGFLSLSSPQATLGCLWFGSLETAILGFLSLS